MIDASVPDQGLDGSCVQTNTLVRIGLLAGDLTVGSVVVETLLASNLTFEAAYAASLEAPADVLAISRNVPLVVAQSSLVVGVQGAPLTVVLRLDVASYPVVELSEVASL